MTYDRVTIGPAALAKGKTQEGVPYVFGGETPGQGFDCSGLVQWAWNWVADFELLPRTTYAQYTLWIFDQRNAHESDPCWPGDLLFIPGSDPIGDEPGHVMMYASPGVVLMAEETGTNVGLFPFDTETGWQYRTRPALHWPAPKYPAVPTDADLARSGLVILVDPEQARQAEANGWPLWIWNRQTGWFVQVLPDQVLAKGTPEYASKHWQVPRP